MDIKHHTHTHKQQKDTTMDDDRDRETVVSHDEGGAQGEAPPPPAGVPGGDAGGSAAAPAMASGDGAEGPVSLRGVFLGNLTLGFRSEEVMEIFTKPIVPHDIPESTYKPIAVDRVDMKRGYCFVFLKDVASMAEKEQVERFVSDMNGMYV